MADAATVVGTAFPSGTVTIRVWEDQILRDLVEAPRDADEPHPLWALSAALKGLGTDIDGILAASGATADDGPMVASCEIEYHAPLRFGVEYEVTGDISGLERKVGRRTGPFDLVTFHLRLTEGGTPATTTTFVWVLPKRDEHAA